MDPPAGFWKRYVAYFVDVVVLYIGVHALSLLYFAVAGGPDLEQLRALLLAQARGEAMTEDPFELLQQLLAMMTQAVVVSSVLYIVLAGAYFIWFEASPAQASLGKQALGLKVTDGRGQRLSVGRAFARFFAAALSWATLNLGHALAAWTRDGRALHDFVADTRVVITSPERAKMPAWGWLIVAVNVAFALLLAFSLVAAMALYLMAVGGI